MKVVPNESHTTRHYCCLQADRRRLYRIVNVLGWAVATTFALLVIYGPYTSDAKYKMTETESAFYNAAFRTGWGLAIAWVVCACATGYGGKRE